MYQRYVIGKEAGTINDIVTFFILCCLVVWLVPITVEQVSGNSMEIFMLPPIWRGEIMCAPDDGANERDYTFSYENGKCYKNFKPGKCNPDCIKEAHKLSEADIQVNLTKAREGIGIHDIFQLMLMGVQYGSIIAALSSLLIMRVKRC